MGLQLNVFDIIILAIISVALILDFYRFLKGPLASDRVMAADTMTVTTASLFVFLGYLFERYIYLDIALIYAVLGFIGVIVIARYLEGGV
jgi:multicomponent Na+:H+ antiporter subunit F